MSPDRARPARRHEPPPIQKLDIGAAPIMAVAVCPATSIRPSSRRSPTRTSSTHRAGGRRGWCDLLGAREREIKIVVDPAKLSAYGLTVQTSASPGRRRASTCPRARPSAAPGVAIKTKGEVDERRRSGDSGDPEPRRDAIRVRDVAEVEDGLEDARSASSLDGNSAIALVIRKQSGANTVAVAAARPRGAWKS